MIANLGILCIFKYFDFFASEFQALMGAFGLMAHPYFLDVALPIGISFYTFQTMSYTIDVYRQKLPATREFLDFALYVAFFPQLIAGPIKRSARLLPQIVNPRTVDLDRIYRGLYFALWGLFLKVVVADNLAKLVDPVFASPGPYEGGAVLLAVYAFSFQIYCDFAGSFMAIGIALMMGISLMESFRRPYFSKNIFEFWRRWHISLSTWFRDYVYIPLGGNRNGPARTVRNLALTMLLCGLWHGAAWTFVVWGLYHGLAIWAYHRGKRFWDRLPVIGQIIVTYHIVCLGWLIFRAESLTHAWKMLRSIFVNFNVAATPGLGALAAEFVALIAVLVAVQVFQDRKNDTLVVLTWPKIVRLSSIAVIAWLTVLFGAFDEYPFIYFQF